MVLENSPTFVIVGQKSEIMDVRQSSPDKGAKKNVKLLFVIAAVLAALLAVLAVVFFSQKQEMQEMVEVITEEKETLSQEYMDLAMDYDSIYTDNDSLRIMLTQERGKIIQLVEEIQTLKATNARRLKEYRKELSTLRTVLRSYIVQVDSLNRSNAQLRREKLAIQEKYQDVQRSVNQLEKERATLHEKVELAAQLEASNITVQQLTSKGRRARRLSKTDKIEFCFTIGKNITAPTGLKAFYIRISNPEEEVLVKDARDLFEYEDKEIPFSVKRIVEYEGEELKLCMYWKVEEFLLSGNYEVHIFADNNMIGSASFVLK